jgi:hypothetical protein
VDEMTLANDPKTSHMHQSSERPPFGHRSRRRDSPRPSMKSHRGGALEGCYSRPLPLSRSPELCPLPPSSTISSMARRNDEEQQI